MTLTRECIETTPQRIDVASEAGSRIGNEPSSPDVASALQATEGIEEVSRDWDEHACDSASPAIGLQGSNAAACSKAGLTIQTHFNSLASVVKNIG
ncbi:hypothetical protein [Prescottella equi]